MYTYTHAHPHTHTYTQLTHSFNSANILFSGGLSI